MLGVLAHHSGENPHVFSDIRHNWVNTATSIRDPSLRRRDVPINTCDSCHFELGSHVALLIAGASLSALPLEPQLTTAHFGCKRACRSPVLLHDLPGAEDIEAHG